MKQNCEEELLNQAAVRPLRQAQSLHRAYRGGKPWLAGLLLRRPRLLQRFTHFYQHLCQLPRQARRRWRRYAVQRRIAGGLVGAALLLALSRAPARAATIAVADGEVAISDNGICSLVEAIENANDTVDGNVHDDCTAGDPAGADTITLPAAGLFAVSYDYYDSTGLPPISSEIIIEGNEAIIERDTSVSELRPLFVFPSGDLTLNDTTLRNGYAGVGGAVYVNTGSLTLNNCTLTNNEADRYGYDGHGGAVLNLSGNVTIINSEVSNNIAGLGGAIFNDEYDSYAGAGTITIISSTISGNESPYFSGGAVFNASGIVTITNSTLSDNTANDQGGGVYNAYNGIMTITNSTLSGNTAYSGGGAYNYYGTLTFERSLVSGNSGYEGDEVVNDSGTITAASYNLFGHSGSSNADAFDGFTPTGSDITATSDGSEPTALADILDTTLADNGGPTETHALVDGSPAIDQAPDGDCDDPPVDGLDQRGYGRNVDGDSTVSGNECDIGAFEYASFSLQAVYMTAAGPGTTDDDVAFGKEDILFWNGGNWSKFFDGVDEGLTTSHDINAIHVNAADDLYLSFFQNKIMTADVGNVLGQDVLHFDGSDFSFYFDGSDVGLTTVGEKIDALHILDGSVSPIGEGCDAYLLISTLGSGKVPAFGGGMLKFNGEDILGFCAIETGADTEGVWHMVLDGSAAGMPKNSTDSISASDDGETIYLTTKGTFDVDSASGSHSEVYKFEGGSFSGPLFSAPDNGLDEKVDGLHVEGDLP